MVKFDNKSFYRKSEDDGFYLGYYEPIYLPYDSTDYYMVIPTKYDLKPGGLAKELYGNPRLLWVFSVMNREIITDPLFDFRAGIIIRVPTKERIESLL